MFVLPCIIDGAPYTTHSSSYCNDVFPREHVNPVTFWTHSRVFTEIRGAFTCFERTRYVNGSLQFLWKFQQKRNLVVKNDTVVLTLHCVCYISATTYKTCYCNYTYIHIGIIKCDVIHYVISIPTVLISYGDITLYLFNHLISADNTICAVISGNCGQHVFKMQFMTVILSITLKKIYLMIKYQILSGMTKRFQMFIIQNNQKSRYFVVMHICYICV